MRLLRSLLIILGLFALAAGGAAAATPERVEPPCHTQSSSHKPDDDRPATPMKVMSCCVAWVVAPPLADSPASAGPVRRDLPAPSLALQLASLSPTPEVTPPRV